MTSKSMKGPQPPKELKPLTREEKMEQVARFFAQKREAFATGILFNLCSGVSSARVIVKADLHRTTIGVDTKGLVKDAVAMADALIKELYPMPEDKPEEKPAEWSG